jgi:hypothetical protein
MRQTSRRRYNAPVTTPVPCLYVRSATPARATVGSRLVAAGVAGVAMVVLVIASQLAPSPAGMGTHEALGLRQCEFLARTGLPCPSCGMTTSFAHFADGNWLASGYTQPMGFVLALLAGLAVWGGAYVAITGRPAWRIVGAVPGMTIVIAMLSLAVAAWAWKIVLVVNGK